MRTTVTLEDDLLEKLRALAQRDQASFKDTLNAVVRRGLTAQIRREKRRKRFKVEPFRSAFRPGVDPVRLNQLVDDLEVERAASVIDRRSEP